MDNDLVLGADLNIVRRFELTVPHMIVLHSHKSGIRISLAVTISLAQDFFLLLIFFKIGRIVLFDIAQLCLGFGGGLRVVLYFTFYLLNCLFNFFGRDFFKVWWVWIGVIITFISNGLGIFPHLLQCVFHIVFIILYRFPPYKGIAPSHRFHLGAIGKDLF